MSQLFSLHLYSFVLARKDLTEVKRTHISLGKPENTTVTLVGTQDSGVHR